ncbi:putative 39s ribosomal protein mitochondrial precursor [Nannochloropsis gaditana]|uniref:Large ribosomal subunit protein uL24c n=1 Tax=Nannochloropsis gaditana TaxID=72520 RepID=W7THV7_9STRA|nr:putative 39s ribosomal protein mitochondrial precursor [Nannochloropsis gaditana]
MSTMNAAMKGMKMLEKRLPHKKKMLEPIKPSRWTIFKGDKVEVINGPETGKQGTIIKVLRAQNRVIIDGVNVRRRTQQPSGSGQPGKIITYPAALHVSNVSLLDPESHEPTRVARRYLESGVKVRVSASSQKILPKPEYRREKIRRAAVSPKDTLPEDVYEVTYEGYLAPSRPPKKDQGPRFVVETGKE